MFGYGSLVNPRSWPPGNAWHAQPARLHGWRRIWGHCTGGAAPGVCVLTMKPDPASSVAGVVIELPAGDLVALDSRERGYTRAALARDAFDTRSVAAAAPIEGYYSRVDHRRCGDESSPILRSYLDCVLDGFFALGGTAALEEFVVTTSGWESPILDERAQPLYPRAVVLAPQTRAAIDDVLRRSPLPRWLGAR